MNATQQHYAKLVDQRNTKLFSLHRQCYVTPDAVEDHLEALYDNLESDQLAIKKLGGDK